MPLFQGSLLTSAGAGVASATVDLLDRDTTTPVRATTTTASDGTFTISHGTEGRFDIRITSGSDVIWRKYDTAAQMLELEVATFKIRNPADTFVYDVLPAAIVANRTLTLPLITGTDTLASLGLAQTFSAAQTFSGGMVGTLTTAAQANITSLGTLTALTVDDVAVNGKVITMTGSASDTAVFTVGTDGTLSLVTTDAAGSAADLTIDADGQINIDANDAAGIFLGINGTNQINLIDGVLKPVTDNDVDLGVSGGPEFKDGFFNGTLEADAITIGGTNVVSGSLITTLGTVSAGVWNGTAIASGYIANDAVTLAKMASGTDGQIITYDASGDPVAVGPGTDGQILTSTGAGSPPAFEDAAGGGIASLAADTTPQVGGSAGLDLQAQLLVGNGGTTGIAISANGEVVMAAQPAFGAHEQSNQLNVTGNGATYTQVFTTERFDQNGDYNGVSLFTAPVTGKYLLAASTRIVGHTSAITYGVIALKTSNLTYNVYSTPDGNQATGPGFHVSMVCDMEGGDTAYVTLNISGESSDLIDIAGSSSGSISFTGMLVG
jgi:hypothetical protein